jgi:hypothetical protein
MNESDDKGVRNGPSDDRSTDPDDETEDAETIDEWDDDVWTDEAKRAATAEVRAFWDDSDGEGDDA